MMKESGPVTRRTILKGLAASAGIAAASVFVPACFAVGQTAKIKFGLMLPYTGTYASLGKNIDDALRLAISQRGGKVGGREVEYVVLDDESEPAKGAENANKLVARDKVDFLIGTVHSGVAMAMVKVATDNDTMLIIPNAGAAAATGPACAPNIFRTSFTNWQPGFAMGKVVANRGQKRAVAVSWDYAAGRESIGGFKEGFASGGGNVEKELLLPFPQVEFQPILTEIAALKPRACVRVLRRRRRGQVREGLCGRRLEELDSAGGRGFPHRRNAGSPGRRGPGPGNHAALRRRARGGEG